MLASKSASITNQTKPKRVLDGVGLKYHALARTPFSLQTDLTAMRAGFALDGS